MPDFAIDYQLLEDVQRRMRELAETADSGGASGALKDLGDSSIDEIKEIMGFTSISGAMHTFANRSSSRAKDAKEGLEKLAGIFESVSDNYFQVDAQMADSAGLMGSTLGLGDWKQDRADWADWDKATADWNAFLKEIGAEQYFTDNPDADINKVCGVPEGAPGFCEAYHDREEVPPQPGPPPDNPRPSETPPTEYTVETDSGSTHIELTLDDDYNVMVEKATITTGEQTYTSVTTYDTPPQLKGPEGAQFDARDYTMVTTSPDGSETTSRYVIDDDGSGTMTVTDSEGKVTEYTRPGPDGEWDEVGGDD